jgi:hypothetical protein
MSIQNVQDLDIAIAELENKKLQQEKELKLQFKNTIESFKPKNLLKAAYNNAMESNGVGTSILKTVGSVGAGLLGNKLLAGTGIIGKIASTAIGSGATDGLFENKNKILAWGKAIANNLFGKKFN